MAKNNKPDFKGQTKNVFDNIVNPEVPTAPQVSTEEPKKNPVGRPRSVGYTRTSVILNDEQMSKVRFISGRDNVNQKDIIEYALQMFIEKYESVYGEIVVEVVSGKRDVNSLFNL